ncbi:hypothetical protein [Halorubellus litoreus]|uniref:Uncharacterized protein n=1 Tax=Halorubellus litoreus TaxID=755308 RepID=A0ABD5VCM1_9EURY
MSKSTDATGATRRTAGMTLVAAVVLAALTVLGLNRTAVAVSDVAIPPVAVGVILMLTIGITQLSDRLRAALDRLRWVLVAAAVFAVFVVPTWTSTPVQVGLVVGLAIGCLATSVLLAVASLT